MPLADIAFLVRSASVSGPFGGETDGLLSVESRCEAKKSLGITSRRTGFGARSQWLWILPPRNEGSIKTDPGTARERRGPIPIDWVQGVAYLDPDRPPNDVPHPNAVLRRAKWAASPQSLAVSRCLPVQVRARSSPPGASIPMIGGLSVGQAQLGNEVGGTDNVDR